MNNKTVLGKLIEIFSTITDVEEINEESELLFDLEISSMDVLVLLCNLEAEFDIKIPEAAMRKIVTVGDVVDVVLSLKK